MNIMDSTEKILKEIREAYEATPEWKTYKEAVKALKEAWVACDAAGGNLQEDLEYGDYDSADEAIEDYKEAFKALKEAKEAKEEAWDAVCAADEAKVRNILKSIQSTQGANSTKLMVPLLYKWRKNNLEKSELLKFCENRRRFWERFSIDSKLESRPFPSIFRHTAEDWLKITCFVDHKFPDKLDNDYYEVCMERISNLCPSIELIYGIIFMDSLYNYVCSQVCSICKTNSDIDIYKSIGRHGLYPNKHNDLIIEYLNIQDQLEQHMLGFISSAILEKMREGFNV